MGVCSNSLFIARILTLQTFSIIFIFAPVLTSYFVEENVTTVGIMVTRWLHVAAYVVVGFLVVWTLLTVYELNSNSGLPWYRLLSQQLTGNRRRQQVNSLPRYP